MCTRSLDSGEAHIHRWRIGWHGMTFQDGVIVTNDWPLVMGNILTSTGAEFEGEIYDVALWSIEVGQEQVLDVMSCSPTDAIDGLVGYWPLAAMKTEPFSMSSVQQWDSDRRLFHFGGGGVIMSCTAVDTVCHIHRLLTVVGLCGPAPSGTQSMSNASWPFPQTPISTAA